VDAFLDIPQAIVYIVLMDAKRETRMKSGTMRKRLRWMAPAAGILLLTGATLQYFDSARSLYTKLKVFSDILERIRTDYVEEKDPDKLVDSAIRGMVADLDPHTTYMTREEYDKWNQDFEGFSGIGIYFDILDGKITILSVIKEGPSEKVGLQTGDRIVSIGGVSAIGIKRDDVPLKLMGPKGTQVNLLVERNGWPKPRAYSIVREEVHVVSVADAFLLAPGTGYIGVTRFSATTDGELDQALQKLELMGMKRLVLDLRQNGGGYLEAAVRVSDRFLPGGKKIVYTRGRTDESFREYFSTERGTHPLIPMIVLIDRTSASASEIVAGAMQDWDRALIVGETSFGKGLVQNPYRFGDGSALLMTTARYHTPAGRVIQRPYRDKSEADYYEEIFDRNWRQKERKKTGRPEFKTMILGRKVWGDGGITPDAFFATDPDTLTKTLRDIVFSPKRPLFTFIENYAAGRKGLKDMDPNEFFRNFRFGTNVPAEFRSHLQNNRIAVTPSGFEKSKEDILFLLKRTLAEKLWGEEAGLKVQIFRDRQIREALGHFPEAESLLAAAYPARRAR
jgi:carboxyl-terminal processing protease